MENYKNVEELYFCYSIRLFHFLKANNFWYKYKEIIPNTKKYVFVFDKTDELMKAVTHFTELKNQNK